MALEVFEGSYDNFPGVPTLRLLAVSGREAPPCGAEYLEANIFPIDPADLFVERSRQWAQCGVPRQALRDARASIRTMWDDGPGGWTWEWIRQAQALERCGRDLAAALVYGVARFPCASTPVQREAHERQLAAYLRASSNFPLPFERTVLEVGYGGQSIAVPTHILTPRNASDDVPTVCFSGGVDTWKMDLHRMALLLVRSLGARVVSIDMPGTGESTVPLTPSADEVYGGVLGAVGGNRKAMWGMSFGGHWAAKLALRGVVNAAVDIGGPVGAISSHGGLLTSLPNGMTGIVAHAMNLDRIPDPAEAEALLARFSLRPQGLLEPGPHCAPLLVANGDADPYVPPEDTTVFRNFPSARVWLVRGGYHCVADRFPRLLVGAAGWLRAQLNGSDLGSWTLRAAGRAIRPPLA